MGMMKPASRMIAVITAALVLMTAFSFTQFSGTEKAYAAETYVTHHVEGYANYNYAYEVLDKINAIRKSYGLPTLTMDKELLRFAMLRAAEDHCWTCSGHTRPNGKYLSYGCEKEFPAENEVLNAESPKQAVDAWMASSGHAGNIWRYEYKYGGPYRWRSTGIGVVKCGDQYSFIQSFSDEPADPAYKSDYKTGLKDFDIEIDTSLHDAYPTLSPWGDDGSYTGGYHGIVGDGNILPLTLRFDGVNAIAISRNDVVYSSDNEGILTIKGDGSARFHKAGSANIIATYAGNTYRLPVTVHKDINDYLDIFDQDNNTVNKPGASKKDPGPGKGKGTNTNTDQSPAKITVLKALAGKNKVKFTWNKPKDAASITGYQLQYRKKGASKWITKSVPGKKLSFTVKKLKKGTRYQFRVTAYIKKGGNTYYGKYSAVKTSGKVKK